MKLYRVSNPNPKPGKRKHQWHGKEKAARDAARELAKKTDVEAFIEIEACEIKVSGSMLAEILNGGDTLPIVSVESVMAYRGMNDGLSE